MSSVSSSTHSKVVVCDLKGTDTRPHNIGPDGRLYPDPFNRIKEVDGKDRFLKLCNACYRRAHRKKVASDKEIPIPSNSKQVVCDLQQGDLKPHNQGYLWKDPLERFKELDGKKFVIKLCNTCYRQALAQKAVEEGKKCDLQGEKDIPHYIGSTSLILDPLKRIKTIDGQERVIKLCNACYRKALAQKVVKDGLVCDLKGTDDKPHTMKSEALYTDPLKRVKEVDGQERVLKLCGACYRSAQKKRKAASEEESKPIDELEDYTLDPVAGKLPAIKQEDPFEDYEEEDEECMVSGIHKTVREVNNALPILQDPNDPTRSVLMEQEGPIEQIKCSNWSDLKNLPNKEKQKITEQVRRWLQLNESDAAKYEEELNKYLEVNYPVDDGPDRGLSVFAKEDIPAYKVVCLYAGALHTDENSLEKSIKKTGSVPVLSYLFGTRSLNRVIDAYKTGNVASLVNTAVLGDGPALGENNLIAILFGKNIVAYVAPQEVKKGTELFLDYGDKYNPLQRAEEMQIKQEEEETALEFFNER